MQGYGQAVGGCIEKDAKVTESRLAAGLQNLGSQAGRLSMAADRLARITGRVAGYDPEPPVTQAKNGGPTPVDSHLAKFHRIGGELNDSLDKLERQLAKLEENAG